MPQIEAAMDAWSRGGEGVEDDGIRRSRRVSPASVADRISLDHQDEADAAYIKLVADLKTKY